MSELSELGKAAVWYCEHDFGIIPLKPHSKVPATIHGLNDWFDNPEDARRLWLEHPEFNVGVVCGSPSHGVLVLDVDVSDTKDGRNTIKAWEASHGELPETAMAITGSGGRHYIYRTSRTNIHPSVNNELGVDIRSDGSYIVAPPSIHPNGTRYEWWEHPEDTPIATATDAVYDFIDHIQRNGGQDETRKDNGKFRLPETIDEGKRDNTLYKYACHLRAIGRSDEEIMTSVAGANLLRCKPPMEQGEIARIVGSACRYEQGSADSDRAVGALGASVAKIRPVEPFRTPRGKILTNSLAKNIILLNHARYIDGALAVWNGRRWVFDKRALEYICLDYADDATSTQRTEVIKYIEVKAEHVSSSKMGKGYYVQFNNATFDVVNMCEVEPMPDMYITATIPIDLDLSAPYGDADRFLESVANGDVPTIHAMSEIIGACMCSRRTISQSPMLIGRPTRGTSTAANGKSTFIDVIRSLLGDENVTSMDIESLSDRYGPAELTGKLANLGDDIPDGFLKGKELSLFKKLVTGNNIKAERKYHDPFDFKPSVTMVFSMNAMPRLADTTDGVFRRLAFIPFRRTFTPSDPDFDPNIIDKLTRTETLQRFAVIGLMAINDLLTDGRDRLTEIPDMVAEVEEIRIDNSVVKRWIWDEEITALRIDHKTVQDVYRDFVDWCDKSGEKYPPRKGSFSAELVAALGNAKVVILWSERLGKKARTYVLASEDTN